MLNNQSMFCIYSVSFDIDYVHLIIDQVVFVLLSLLRYSEHIPKCVIWTRKSIHYILLYILSNVMVN